LKNNCPGAETVVKRKYIFGGNTKSGPRSPLFCFWDIIFSSEAMKPVDIKQLFSLCEPVVTGQGYELVDLEWKHEAGAWVLRLFIDKPEGPSAIGLDDCASVSRELSAVLDVADALHVAYSLEVSSPGLNRPLKKEADFRRFVGKKAKIRTKRPIGPEATRRNFSGTLVDVGDGKVRIDVGDQVCEVPVDDVEKANLVYEF
jgi:ribosome maturation factor RimP